MARMKREAVIAALREKGIEFDENAPWGNLWKLLKNPIGKLAHDVPPGEPVDLSPDDQRRIKRVATCFPNELIDRAKKIGFTDEQIGTYTDSEKLKAACDQIKPQATVHPPLGPRQPYKPFPKEVKGTPAQARFTSTITTTRAQNLVRAGYDDSNLGVFLRANKIRRDAIQKVTVVRNYIPDKKGILTTTMVIDYLKKG